MKLLYGEHGVSYVAEKFGIRLFVHVAQFFSKIISALKAFTGLAFEVENFSEDLFNFLFLPQKAFDRFHKFLLMTVENQISRKRYDFNISLINILLVESVTID